MKILNCNILTPMQVEYEEEVLNNGYITLLPQESGLVKRTSYFFVDIVREKIFILAESFGEPNLAEVNYNDELIKNLLLLIKEKKRSVSSPNLPLENIEKAMQSKQNLLKPNHA